MIPSQVFSLRGIFYFPWHRQQIEEEDTRSKDQRLRALDLVLVPLPKDTGKVKLYPCLSEDGVNEIAQGSKQQQVVLNPGPLN